MPGRLHVSAIALASMLSSCEGRSTRTMHERTDSAGLAIVSSRSPAWGADAASIDPEPTVRIGSEEAGPYQFAFVLDGRLLRNGDVAVVEPVANEVRVFAADGAHKITYGGPGEGPGEFRGLVGVFVYRGDSLVAWDEGLRRATIFPTSPGNARVVDAVVNGNFSVFGVAGGHTLLMYSAGSSFRRDLKPGLQWTRTDVLALDASTGASRTIANLADRERLVAADGNAPMPQPLRYAIQAAGPDGFYWGTPDRYEIQYYDSQGNPRRIIRRNVQPRAVDQAMINKHVENQLERVRQTQGEAAVAGYRRRLEEEAYGDHVPVFTSAFVDGDARLWVAESAWPSVEFPARWSVFSSDGVWLGDLDAPDRLRIVDARADHVLGVWLDSMEVPHVQVHRLVMPSQSLLQEH